MMKKTIKVKPDERSQLVEFIVTKRVKYLEYLMDLHSDEGGLWMNTILVDRSTLGRYFMVPSDCLSPPADGSAAGMIRIPLDTADAAAIPAAAGVASAAPAETDAEAYTYVSVDKLPHPASSGKESSIAEWQQRVLPCFSALAMALSDLLLVPIGGAAFMECFHHLLLEVELAYAGGVAARTLLARNLKTARQHLSPELVAVLSTRDGDVGVTPTAAASAAVDQLKYVFLHAQQHAYTAAPPSYDAVMPALFNVLIYAYRRLCDYDVIGREDGVKRVLAIDRRIEKLVLARLGKALEKAAGQRLVREAYVLSPRGLFAEAAGDDTDADFIAEIVAAQMAEAAKSRAGAGAAGEGGGDVGSSSDSEEVVDDAQ